MAKKEYAVLLIDSSMPADLCRQLFTVFVRNYLPPEIAERDIKWANETRTQVKERIMAFAGSRAGYYIPLPTSSSETHYLLKDFYKSRKNLCEVFNTSDIRLGKIL